MRLSEETFENIEEFLSLIPITEGEDDLEFAIERVRRLCEEDIYELNSFDREELAFEILRALEEVWDLLLEEHQDSGLHENYEELMRDLESESPDGDFQSEDDEEENIFEEYSERDDECEEEEWI